MQNLNFNGSTIFYLVDEYGRQIGAVVRREGLPDTVLDTVGLKNLAQRLHCNLHSLTNATLTTAGKIVPKATGSVGTITKAEYKAQRQAQAVQQPPAPQPSPQPPPAATQAVQKTQKQKLTEPTNSQYIDCRHAICKALIRYLYGVDADIEKFKAYDGKVSRERLAGVDITEFDRTEEEAIVFLADEKFYIALEKLKCVSESDDTWFYETHGQKFKLFAESGVNGKSKKSTLHVHPVRRR